MRFLGFSLSAYVTQPLPPPPPSHHTFFHPVKNMKYAASKGRGKGKKNLPPARLSIYLVPECVSATQPQLRSGPDSPHKHQGGPISRLNGPLRCWCWASTQGWVGAARNISDILRRQAEVSSPPHHQRQTSNPRKLM